jgi:chromosome partitioning protein
MPVIAMINQKGGVGRTSTCHHLAGALADAGRRVLLVDNDPQASLSQGIFGCDVVRDLDPRQTIAGVYRLEIPDPRRIIHHTCVNGVDLLIGSKHVHAFNQPTPQEADRKLRGALGEAIAEVRDLYDLILIDCPPTLFLCTYAALLASDALIVPMQPELYCVQEMVDVEDFIDLVRLHNGRLALLGYLLTMVNPLLSIHKLWERKFRAVLGGDAFRGRIPVATDFKESILIGKPVSHYKPRSAAAKVMRELASEVDERLERQAAAKGAA